MSKLKIKGLIKKALKDMWQSKWDGENKGRHLYNIQKTVGNERRIFGNRKEDSIMSHTALNHSLYKITLYMSLDFVLNVIFPKQLNIF